MNEINDLIDDLKKSREQFCLDSVEMRLDAIERLIITMAEDIYFLKGKDEFRYAVLSAIEDNGIGVGDAVDAAFDLLIKPKIE